MTNCFKGKDWICVLNLSKDKFSNAQLEVLKDVKEKMKEDPMQVIDCGDARNEHVSLCSSVNAFPAVCSKKDNKCMYGLKRTMDEFESVCLAIKKKE